MLSHVRRDGATLKSRWRGALLKVNENYIFEITPISVCKFFWSYHQNPQKPEMVDFEPIHESGKKVNYLELIGLVSTTEEVHWTCARDTPHTFDGTFCMASGGHSHDNNTFIFTLW